MPEADGYEFTALELEKLKQYQGAINAHVFSDGGDPAGDLKSTIAVIAERAIEVLDSTPVRYEFSPGDQARLNLLQTAIVGGHFLDDDPFQLPSDKEINIGVAAESGSVKSGDSTDQLYVIEKSTPPDPLTLEPGDS